MKDESKATAADDNDVAKAIEKVLRDISANKKQLEETDTADMEKEVIFPELKIDVSGRARKTHKIHDGLVKLQELQKKDLEGSASVNFFQKFCKFLSLCSKL